MKTEVLLRSIGKINDELIADAESEANTKRKPGWAKLGTMAACLALVLCTGIATHAIRSNATAGTFTMDVNPSVEYTIAKSGSVKNVRCLNSDAENALSDVAMGKQSVQINVSATKQPKSTSLLSDFQSLVIAVASRSTQEPLYSERLVFITENPPYDF